jgi:hypothetical protein
VEPRGVGLRHALGDPDRGAEDGPDHDADSDSHSDAHRNAEPIPSDGHPDAHPDGHESTDRGPDPERRERAPPHPEPR